MNDALLSVLDVSGAGASSLANPSCYADVPADTIADLIDSQPEAQEARLLASTDSTSESQGGETDLPPRTKKKR